MFEDNKDYLVSTKYLYYILGSFIYNEDMERILKYFIRDMHEYREYADSEFDYYILSGKSISILAKYYSVDDLEITNDKKKLVREVV